MALDASAIRVYCRGTDLSAQLQSTALDRVRDEVDVTTYPSAIREMQATFQRVTLVQAGLYEDGAHSIADVLRQARNSDEEGVTVCPQGPTVGNIAFIVAAFRTQIVLPAESRPGDVIKCSARAMSRRPVGEGVVGLNGTISAASQTAAYNLGALASNAEQLLATVHLLNVTGTPTITPILESDDLVGFGSATTRATGAAMTARSGQLLAVAGPITDAWWRVRWTFSGTGSATAVVALGRAV